MNNEPVIIVGAGLSGLYLAAQLERQKIAYWLLEARQRCGGRIESSDGFDLGPAWFWPAHTAIHQLIEQLGLGYQAQPTQGDALYQTATGVQRIGHPAATPSYRLDNGMQGLVDALLQQIPKDKIVLGCKVSAIGQNRQGVSVDMGKSNPAKQTLSVAGESTRSLTGSKVVLALPPRLVAGMIRFSPELTPEFMSELASIPTWMAGHAKAIIRFERPFWRAAQLSGFAFSEAGPLLEIYDASLEQQGKFGLFGFFALPPAQRNAVGIEALKQQVVNQLVSLFGVQAKHFLSIEIMDWASERFTAVQADQLPLTHHPLYSLSQVHHWHKKLIFASSESAQRHGGFLEGALLASQHAWQLCQT